MGAMSLLVFQKLLKTEHLLWQLYSIEKEVEKIEAELEDERLSLQQAREESSDNGLAAKKKEQSAFLKKITLCEKNMAKKKIDIDKKVGTLFSLVNPTNLPS